MKSRFIVMCVFVCGVASCNRSPDVHQEGSAMCAARHYEYDAIYDCLDAMDEFHWTGGWKCLEVPVLRDDLVDYLSDTEIPEEDITFGPLKYFGTGVSEKLASKYRARKTSSQPPPRSFFEFAQTPFYMNQQSVLAMIQRSVEALDEPSDVAKRHVHFGERPNERMSTLDALNIVQLAFKQAEAEWDKVAADPASYKKTKEEIDDIVAVDGVQIYTKPQTDASSVAYWRFHIFVNMGYVIGANGNPADADNGSVKTSQTVHLIVDEETVNFDQNPLRTAKDLQKMYVLFQAWVHFPKKTEPAVPPI